MARKAYKGHPIIGSAGPSRSSTAQPPKPCNWNKQSNGGYGAPGPKLSANKIGTLNAIPDGHGVNSRGAKFIK